jgi:hypothetical protein
VDANGKSGGLNMEGGTGNSNAPGKCKKICNSQNFPGMGGKGSPFRQGSTHTITKSVQVENKAYSEQAVKEARAAAQVPILLYFSDNFLRKQFSKDLQKSI